MICIFRLTIKRKSYQTHLNMKINKTNKAKKVATLSIVLSITTSCLRSAGMKRTSLSIRSSRKVRRTERPLAPPCCVNSIILGKIQKII